MSHSPSLHLVPTPFTRSPEERLESVQGHVECVLRSLDPEPTRDGLQGTGERVARALVNELLYGYQVDPRTFLTTMFDNTLDQMVMVANIPVYSMCEHHMLPFIGEAWVAYIPAGGRVVGISKLARAVDAYARRLQIQERLTQQIADAVQEVLRPQGVGVHVRCKHLCMLMRGAQAQQATTLTTCLRGLMHEQDRAREEFLQWVAQTS